MGVALSHTASAQSNNRSPNKQTNLAAVQAQLRNATQELRINDAALERPDNAEAVKEALQRKGIEIRLSFTEFRLLELLVRNQGRVVPRTAIVEQIWGDRREVEINTIDAFVRLVRKKIDDSGAERVIQTHRGIGYSIRVANCA